MHKKRQEDTDTVSGTHKFKDKDDRGQGAGKSTQIKLICLYILYLFSIK